MNLSQLLNKIDDIESSSRLLEGLNSSERKSALLWESAGRSLREAQLNPQQITQLFQDIEKSLTDAGSNRTGLGQGKDVAVAVNRAWQDLKAKVGSSGPIKNIDAMYDQAAEKLKQATGGDTGVMQYVQKYRDFAKKHPIAQSLIYSALIAAAGISGAGIGGAAALGLLKLTDKLLQGEKFSKAAYAGAKTGGLAYAAGQIGKAFHGSDQATTAVPNITDDMGYDQAYNFYIHKFAQDPDHPSAMIIQQAKQFAATKANAAMALSGATDAGNNISNAVDASQSNSPVIRNPPYAVDNGNGPAVASRLDALNSQNSLVQDFAGKMGLTGANHTTNFVAGVPVSIDGVPVPTNLYTPDQLKNISVANALKAGMGETSDAGNNISNAVDATQSNAPVIRNPPYAVDNGNGPEVASKSVTGTTSNNVPNVTDNNPVNMNQPKQGAAAGQWKKFLGLDKNVTADQLQAAKDNYLNSAGNVNPQDATSIANNPISQSANQYVDANVDAANAASQARADADYAQQVKQYLQQQIEDDANADKALTKWASSQGLDKSQMVSAVAKDDAGNFLPGWSQPKGSDWFVYNPTNDPEQTYPENFRLHLTPKTGDLKESYILGLFALVETRLLDEGVLDGIKKAAGAVSNWAGTTGHNLTTKVTADKLQSAWKQAGSPTDSEQVKQILTNAGVDAGVVDKAFTDMGIATATVTPSQTANKVGDTATADTGIAKATVPSNQTVNIDDIVARIKKLAPADQQRVLAFLQAK